jgi:hypothetical protein
VTVNANGWCGKHRSFFCPCANPSLYARDPEGAAAWDDPSLAATMAKRRKPRKDTGR